MNKTHSVRVSVTHDTSQKDSVLESRHCKLPRRFLNWLCGGGESDVLVLLPGDSVNSVVIREEQEGDEVYEAL